MNDELAAACFDEKNITAESESEAEAPVVSIHYGTKEKKKKHAP